MQFMERRGRRPVFSLRAIRGAVQIDMDSQGQIADATVGMIRALIARNGLKSDDLISFFFTVTPDLTSEIPTLAAAEAGWAHVPMLCAAEMESTQMIPRTVRVLVHVHWRNRHRNPSHAYLSGTTSKRPEPSQVVSQPVGMGSLQSLGTDRRCP